MECVSGCCIHEGIVDGDDEHFPSVLQLGRVDVARDVRA
jgi:hypothetical protein